MKNIVRRAVKATGVCSMLLASLTLPVSPVSAADINISAAASLKEVINELCDRFGARKPGTVFVRNFAASGALAKQIENGAPADLFISASVGWMDYLKERKLLDASSVGTFASNVLVFVGGGEKKAGGMQDLARLEKIAVGSPKSVPAGEYAMEAMKKAGVAAALEKKLVMARDVRECLMYVERSEVDGAFVYRTDALQARQAKILFVVPQDLCPPVVYPIALTAAGAKKKESLAFIRYLQGGEAKKILMKYGFGVK